MAVTQAQAKAFLGVTDAQLVKIIEYLDAVSPKFDSSDPPVKVSNTRDNFRDHVVGHYKQLYKTWRKSQDAEPTF